MLSSKARPRAATRSQRSHGLTTRPVSRGRPSTRPAKASITGTALASVSRVSRMRSRVVRPRRRSRSLSRRADVRLPNRVMADQPFNVLFLCTGNSARSIIAEAILNKVGAGRFRAYSAGSYPKGKVHPETVRLLQSLGYQTSGFRSKSWDEFTVSGAPPFDFVFTVCDN